MSEIIYMLSKKLKINQFLEISQLIWNKICCKYSKYKL